MRWIPVGRSLQPSPKGSLLVSAVLKRNSHSLVLIFKYPPVVCIIADINQVPVYSYCSVVILWNTGTACDYVYRTTYLDLTLCARSVGTSLASYGSHFETASLHDLLDISSGSFFSQFLLALSVLFPIFLLSFRVRACTPSTASRASPATSRMSADAGG